MAGFRAPLFVLGLVGGGAAVLLPVGGVNTIDRVTPRHALARVTPEHTAERVTGQHTVEIVP